MKLTEALPGTLVTINSDRDLYFEHDRRSFITHIESENPILNVYEVIKVTKGGLIHIRLDEKRTDVFCPYNVDKWDNENDRWKALLVFNKLLKKLEEE
jgi:hypothetical protein